MPQHCPDNAAAMSVTILIVDDSKLARMSVVKSLKALQPDWTRLEAGNAEEALALTQNSNPDIALLDFNMPGLDGLDLAAELRDSHPRMVIALISANRQQDVIARAEAMQASFLAKPLTEAALAVFLTKAVDALGKD
ncbi:Protein-glutamate methylesterase/protein-glutamine glutaminase [Paraburkholderia metrosideri]|jgi:CheY-like chemotaxis protein|uniref:Protein-glutamate methylesterase/protein-glutamine glutaminase n=2 Tax=Paraburkholderia metrosideri TaxID=580937 RepID=A0ABM8NHN2_9BURK|nr:Protein-glutamate methylesterase/protein-glutamine glutaminase [Paraburkholderia metrosideri]